MSYAEAADLPSTTDIYKAPANVEFLALAIGNRLTFEFIEKMAGQVLHIPKKPRGSSIEQRFGESIAKALCTAFPGENWMVPVCRPWRIRMHYADGFPVNQIAARVGVSRRAVYLSLSRPYRTEKLTKHNGRYERAQATLNSREELEAC